MRSFPGTTSNFLGPVSVDAFIIKVLVYTSALQPVSDENRKSEHHSVKKELPYTCIYPGVAEEPR